MPLPPDQKTRIFELCPLTLLPTDGTTSTTYVDLDVPGLERAGTDIEQMQVLTATNQRMSAHSWAVYVTWLNKGRTWSTPVAITANLEADAETIETAYTSANLTNFAGLKMKLLLGTKNVSGALRNTALVRAWLVVRYRS